MDTKRTVMLVMVSVPLALLTACGGGSSASPQTTTETNTTEETTTTDTTSQEETTDTTTGEQTFPTATATLPINYTADAGRLLGSQCAQCHGTNGVSVNSWDSIAGEGNLNEEIYESHALIMAAQADGYTSSEVTLIGNWLKTLPRTHD